MELVEQRWIWKFQEAEGASDWSVEGYAQHMSACCRMDVGGFGHAHPGCGAGFHGSAGVVQTSTLAEA